MRSTMRTRAAAPIDETQIVLRSCTRFVLRRTIDLRTSVFVKNLFSVIDSSLCLVKIVAVDLFANHTELSVLISDRCPLTSVLNYPIHTSRKTIRITNFCVSGSANTLHPQDRQLSRASKRQQPVWLLYLSCSRSARPLPRGSAGHVAHPSRSIPMSVFQLSAFSRFSFS